ncbi:histidine kinase [Streptomyces cinereospinus]
MLALLSAVECGVEGVPFARDAGLPVAAGVAFGALAGVTLLLRRMWPIAVVLVSIAISPAQMGFLLTVVGLYTLAASELPRRIITALAGMSLVGTLVVTFVRAQQDMTRGRWGGRGVVRPVHLHHRLAGRDGAAPADGSVRGGARRRLMESLRERADSLERELQLLAERAEERAEWARNEERTRIAREMHDVVAHRVSLMVVHAAALQAVARKDPEKAVKNAALVGDMGRQALTELREMLGVLRSTDGGARGAVSGRRCRWRRWGVARRGGVAGRRGRGGRGGGRAVPVGAGRADRAVGRHGDGGGAVGRGGGAGVRAGGRADGVPRGAGGTDQRPQACGGGAKTYVRLAHRVSEIAMQVENEPPPEAASSARLPSGGNGLVGMRERVVGLGGVFVSGPTDAGGFRVSAVIPAS